MTNKLWKELDDSQAENLAGGASVFDSYTGYFRDVNQDGTGDATDVILTLISGGYKVSEAQVKDPAKHSSIVFNNVIITHPFLGTLYEFSYNYKTNGQEGQEVRKLV